jgi:hypothetical protein
LNWGLPDCALSEGVWCEAWQDTHEKKKRGKAETKYQRPSEVRIVHYMLVDPAKGVQNCHGFGSYVREVDAKF